MDLSDMNLPVDHGGRALSPPFIAGDYYAGAHGPTIIMILSSADAAVWLQQAVREMALHAARRVLTEEPEVRLNNVGSIVMTHTVDGPRLTLKRGGTNEMPAFLWAGTSEGWLYLADLIEPFCEGQSGHHYLTEAQTDDAVIELSLGEHHG
jgi:hypothetical protein